MIYNTQSEEWRYLVDIPVRFKYEDMYEYQNWIFDELDDKCEILYGKPYFS